MKFVIGKWTPNIKTVIIDDCDSDLLSFAWHPCTPNKGTLTYAYRAKILETGKRRNVSMHREIAARMVGRPLTRKDIVDHVNGNGLDNRRENLRVCTFAENLRNRKKRTSSKSPYKGITWHTEGKKWQASICANGRSYYLGLHDTPEEAHEAYCKAAIELHGEFANFGAHPTPEPELPIHDFKPFKKIKELAPTKPVKDDIEEVYQPPPPPKPVSLGEWLNVARCD